MGSCLFHPQQRRFVINAVDAETCLYTKLKNIGPPMKMMTPKALLASLALSAVSHADTAIPDAPFALLEKYCMDCHDDATAKAKLSFESLPADFFDGRWVRVHDRISNQQMPPKNKPQPSPDEAKQLTDWLSKELTRASLARQQSDGRSTLRRMNRREYETTLHDLLGIATPLQALLPQDNSIRGFDTVSRGLTISATHLLSYQRAAAAAIDAALPKAPLASTVVRISGKKYLEGRLPVHRGGIDPFVRVEGESLVLHARLLYGDNSMQAPKPSVPGRYRIRASVRPVNNGGKPMSVLIGKRVDRFQVEKLMHIVDFADIPPGKATVIEAETDLLYSQGNQFIYFEGMELPSPADFEKQRGGEGKKPLPADFAGPGLLVEWAELEGPLDAELGYQRMFGDLAKEPRMPEGWSLPPNWNTWNPGEFAKKPLAAVSLEPKADADRLIRGFLPLAFRRPATAEQAAHHVKIVHNLLDQGETFDEAMRAGYKAILCSSAFLYYAEEPGRLDDHALAARLARFLWNSLPDAELSALASGKKLSSPAVLQAQTERMLKDPKAARFVHSFTDQWLDLGKFLDMKPDGIYLEYDEHLAWSMPMESRKFFEEMLTSDLPVASIVQSDWTFLNSRLARHYGLPDVPGLELRKTSVPANSRRGGLITQASILKLTTNASYTSPIMRGVWVLDRILGKMPPPPPPNVQAIEPDIRGATTIREQLEKHKNVATCASCHVHIDPPGFALENFDVVGGWRERYRVNQGGEGNERVELVNYPGKQVWLAKPVQADGETDDGQRFQDITEYKKILLKDPDQVTRNLAAKLILYSTGAEIDFADRAIIEQIVRDVKAKNHGLRSLVHAVIQSPLFLQK